MLWVEENQKIIWVVLLVLLAPTFAMTGLFRPGLSPEDIVEAEIFGEPLTRADIQRSNREIEWVQSILQLAMMADFNLPPAFRETGDSWREGQLSTPAYHAYLREARARGVSVSDAELGECVRDLWQRLAAVERSEKATASLPPLPPGDQNAAFQRQFQRMEESRKALEELRGGDGRAFDAASWATYLQRFDPAGRGSKKINVAEFESALRNFCAIAKLEALVKGSAQITPQEVFEEYRKEKQTRKLSWSELKAPEEAQARVGATLTADELRKHYEVERQRSFLKPTSIRTSWLLLPKEHFQAEVEKALTDEDLEKHYKENRNEYRRPTILAEESTFALRSAEEKKALEEKLFLPLADVKAKVREQVLEQRTKNALQDLARTLTTRIFPTKPAGSTGPDPVGVSFAELVKENPALRTGTTGYLTREEIKAGLGDAYTNAVEGWFTAAESKRPVNPPRYSVNGDKGQVFYTQIDVRAANAIPTFEEIEAEVRKHLARRRVLDEMEKALKAVVAEVNEGKKDFAAAQAAGIDIDVAGSKLHIAASTIESTPDFVGKNESLKVPRKGLQEKKDPPADPDDAGDAEDDLEPHASSDSIVDAVFNLPDTDKGKAALATDEKAGSLFLLRLDDLKLPNPGKFDDSKSYLESRLRREREQTAFTEWRNDLLRRARQQEASPEASTETATKPEAS
jgi:hypothetical protein